MSGALSLAVLAGCDQVSPPQSLALPTPGASLLFRVRDGAFSQPTLELTLINRAGRLRSYVGDIEPMGPPANLYLTADDWVVLIIGKDIAMFDIDADRKPRAIPAEHRPRAATSSWTYVGLVLPREDGQLGIFSPTDLERYGHHG
ncbi:hypothetical protein [Brevundimonas subvibrioides]|uniref:Uncharacterized protein n=1 Tax=Brevundimonas subvibrioides (strain ATCC 15264 / DSM 4735 / LMG 14903 / NBRC 16000 / CB 81) TaxID=633149 RepID=D9QHB4_BRESC|nr:hypothetical protein [Brevundimonas subvibrioides]ADL01080.1 hypothetical protein Bresu_1769 [Brevundimonas subvibrioides ATCC 15264]